MVPICVTDVVGVSLEAPPVQREPAGARAHVLHEGARHSVPHAALPTGTRTILFCTN